ncbi:hypothetical protein BJV82DRAFT_161104 [Fennellomyces sp. T-0311]|nr:hypothetical protein BJV82DRAFT_161104 [Fennellomyces sp. T-0311]
MCFLTLCMQDVIRQVLESAQQTEKRAAQLFGLLVDHKLLVPFDQYYQVVQTSTFAQGVFVPLTQCYSSRCTPRQPSCYSPSCPYNPNSNLIANESASSSSYLTRTDTQGSTDSSYFSVSAPSDDDMPDHLPLKERKRQAALAEVLLSEEQYCRDLTILRTVYAEALLDSSAIEETRRQKFHDIVFANYEKILAKHENGCEKLNALRQDDGLFSDQAGIILFKHVSNLTDEYIIYAANHVKAAYVVQYEMQHSESFRDFVTTQDAQECTRRLGLRHYLTLPTLRIGKYRLLLKALTKYTIDEGDLLSLGAALAELKYMLAKMNEVTRQAEIETRRLQIETSLRIPEHIPTTLEQILLNDNVELLYEGKLLLARSSHSFTATPCYIFLFAHLLLVTRARDDEYVVAGPPIPLHMLRIEMPRRFRELRNRKENVEMMDSVTGLHIRARLRRFRQSFHQKTAPAELVKTPRSPSPPAARRRTHRLRMLTVSHLGYPESTYHFACPTLDERERWRQQLVTASQNAQMLIDRAPFRLNPLCEVAAGSSRQSIRIGGSAMFPTGCGRIWCTLPFVDDENGGQAMLALGTQYGVWVGPRDGSSRDFWLAVPHDDCQQLAILDNSILLVRAYHRRNALMAFDLKLVCQRMAIRDRGWGFVRRSAVVSFAAGTLDNKTVLAYLTRKRRHRHQRLILVQYKASSSFRKLKEFRLDVKDAVQVQIAHNTIFLLSPSQGVCRISQDEQWQHVTGTGFVPFTSHHGYIYDAKTAKCVGFQSSNLSNVQNEIQFESRVQRVAVVYPYLIGFSHSVVEVRHVETVSNEKTCERSYCLISLSGQSGTDHSRLPYTLCSSVT